MDVTSFRDLDLASRGDESQPMEVTDPRDGNLALRNGKPIVLHVRSRDARKHRQTIDAEINRNTKKANVPTAESNRKQNVRLDAQLITGWENVPADDGTDLPYSQANAQRLLESWSFVHVQLIQFATKEANFLPVSSASSPSSADTTST